MNAGYITFGEARTTQAAKLGEAVDLIRSQVAVRSADGELAGPGPIFVGIGASLAAACAPVWALRSRGVHSWRLGAGDLPIPFPQSIHPVIGISQSGRSAETLAVLGSIDEAQRYAVVNTSPSPVTGIAPKNIRLGNIPDSYASTIGYTATVAALGIIADAWDGGSVDAGWAELAGTFQRVESELTEHLQRVARVFGDAGSVDFVGAGPSVGSAEAGALLFREVARIHSTAMSTRQYLHGSMESAGDGVHVVLGNERELDLARTLAGAGHRVILISSEPVEESRNLQTVLLPGLPAAQRSILEALVMQTLVGEAASLRSVDVEEFVFHNSDTKVEAAPSGKAGV
jgi:fructoselysine-6-P-deglycase FrlB-like protein